MYGTNLTYRLLLEKPNASIFSFLAKKLVVLQFFKQADTFKIQSTNYYFKSRELVCDGAQNESGKVAGSLG